MTVGDIMEYPSAIWSYDGVLAALRPVLVVVEANLFAMFTVDKTSPVPPYLQIKRILRERILKGELSPGERLVGERRLAKEFAVSPVTMSKALAELVQEGLITRRFG